MASRFPDLTFFIDAGGRYSHSKEVPIVFAGIAVATKDVNEIRDSLLTAAHGPLCKWSNGKETKECARVIFRFLSKRQLIGVVRTVWKNTPEWDKYFNEGERQYQQGVQRAQEPMPYAKPMATFKLHQFGRVCGSLTGFFAKRHRDKLPKKSSPIKDVAVTAVFDSDIQGEIIQRVWKNVFPQLEREMKQTRERLRISPKITLEIKTEQEEPLLLMADYLAGYYYSRVAYKAQQDNDWTQLLKAVEPMVHNIPAGCHRVVDEPFRDAYLLTPSSFDQILPKKKRGEIAN